MQRVRNTLLNYVFRKAVLWSVCQLWWFGSCNFNEMIMNEMVTWMITECRTITRESTEKWKCLCARLINQAEAFAKFNRWHYKALIMNRKNVFKTLHSWKEIFAEWEAIISFQSHFRLKSHLRVTLDISNWRFDQSNPCDRNLTVRSHLIVIHHTWQWRHTPKNRTRILILRITQSMLIFYSADSQCIQSPPRIETWNTASNNGIPNCNIELDTGSQ